MPAELFRDEQAAHFPGDPNLYGMTCHEHPDAHRKHLGQAHATNAVAKHNRDHHAEPTEPAYQIGALAALVADAWDEWTDAIAEGLADPDVAHKATPLQRRYLTLREAWMVVLGLDDGLDDDTRALAEARLAAHENHHAVRPTF